jgi:hypothetical protein
MFSTGFRNRWLVGVVAGTVALGFGVLAVAQDAKPPTAQGSQTDPLTRPIPEEQRKKNAKALKIELSKTYRKWLDEDVRWIITDDEKHAFMQLSNDEERDQFIEGFWQRRDPTPDTEENEFKEEHYRRRHSRLEKRSRPDVHRIWPTRRDRLTSFWRQLRTAHGGRRR